MAADELYGVDVLAAGPLVDPRFSRAHTDADRTATRRELGLRDDECAVLISAGSLGLGDVPALVDGALRNPAAHVLVLCGRNAGLREELDALPRVTALGWRDDVPALMAASDVLLHNAGGLSVTEALVANLPAVTYLPIPGHGRANATVPGRRGPRRRGRPRPTRSPECSTWSCGPRRSRRGPPTPTATSRPTVLGLAGERAAVAAAS